ncbi:MAG: hypothetical protein LBE95_03005 [Holosporaceae bacterium]|nr:hypothetical protein [Holosporaceae bacterium]
MSPHPQNFSKIAALALTCIGKYNEKARTPVCSVMNTSHQPSVAPYSHEPARYGQASHRMIALPPPSAQPPIAPSRYGQAPQRMVAPLPFKPAQPPIAPSAPKADSPSTFEVESPFQASPVSFKVGSSRSPSPPLGKKSPLFQWPFSETESHPSPLF